MENATTAARERFDSLLPRARSMYAEGKSATDVIRALYGVELPSEVYVYLNADPNYELDLGVDRTAHPWMVIGAQVPGRQDEPGDWEREQEETAFVHFPQFLPLLRISANSSFDGYLIGYDLDELRAGRSTIFGHRGPLSSGATLEKLGESLLAVMHASLADELAMLMDRHGDPQLRGMDAVLEEDMSPVRTKIDLIEALQREAAAG